jgi:dihydroorotate dehydrogenase (fumarate)
MANLKASYMGLELKNPVIVGANNMVTGIDNLKRMEQAGAAAIVYKSLFEEQIHLENLDYYEDLHEYEERNAEMITLFPNIKDIGPEEHLMKLQKAKEAVSIPVFASLNAVYDETWVEYAAKIQETGVDGIELNFYILPDTFALNNGEIEKKQVSIVRMVRKVVTIPISIKLSPFYSNPLRLISDMEAAGADAFVLFNRLFQADIDLQGEHHHFYNILSNKEDNRLPLRFAGLLYGNINASICANTGVFTGEDVVKMILAGADCVQIVSTLYKNKIEVIKSILSDLETWMDKKGYESLNDFQGKLSQKKTQSVTVYHRAQYVDILMNATEILQKHKLL